MNSLPLMLRIIRRDWRAGELQLLLLSLILAMTCYTAISFFSLSIKQSMGVQASNVLGGNLVLISPSPVPKEWLKQANELHLQQAYALNFLSVLAANDNFQLASVKAVSKNYPLLGQLRIRVNGSQKAIDSIPKINQIWLEPRLYNSLKITKKQKLTLGSAEFNASQVLSFDPSRAGSFFNFSPKAIINIDDVAKTKVIQPGSRIEYRWYFTGDKKKITAFASWLKPKLKANQKLLTPEEGQVLLKNAYQRIDVFLKLASLISLLLCGVVIALSVRRFLQRHRQHIALMRCFGSQEKQILSIYTGCLFALGLIGILAGSILGYSLQPVLLFLTKNTFKSAERITSLTPFFSSFIYGYILLFGFSLPILLQLKEVVPASLLRNKQQNIEVNKGIQISSGLLLLIVLSWWQLGDLKFTLNIVLGTCLGTTLFASMCFLIIRAIQGLRSQVGVSWRYGLANLARQPQHAITQILSFSITLSILLLISLVWQDLAKNWQQQLPLNAPNYFAFNIAPSQVKSFNDYLNKNQIEAANIYPMVKGRMIQLNNKPVLEAVPESAKNNNALHRELNLSWTATLPANNNIISGNWWSTKTKPNSISVEKNLAKNLGLKLGDELSFQIGSEITHATISNIRSVDWTQFTPNFFIIFPNDKILANYPTTYITSFYLPASMTSKVNQLVKKFPNVSILDIANILQQVRDTVMGFAYLIGVLNGFILLAGISILFASTQATLDRRIEEGLLLRVIGATRKQVMLGLLAEFLIIGIISGLISIFIANGIAYYLSVNLLKIPYQLNIPSIAISLIACPLFVAIAGWLSTHQVRSQPLRNSINTSE
jgi:putative ABC transport system permease protein